jgi:sec-independent protein translocase protein TatA
MPFGLQPIHLLVIAIVALLIFGPSRLPEIGRGVGRALTEFRKGAREMSESFMEEVKQPEETAQNIIAQPSMGKPSTSVTGEDGDLPNGAVSFDSVATAQGNFCTHCGTANPAGARYCNHCGQKIAE